MLMNKRMKSEMREIMIGERNMGKWKRTDKGVNEGITKVSEGRGGERDDRRKEGKRKPYTAPTRYLKLKTLG
jgi:hypothetical protein